VKPRARFGIGLPHGEMDHEWEQLERSKPVTPLAHDNGHEPETLLYGPRGGRARRLATAAHRLPAALTC
jgi:hypothetical protein